MHKPILCGTVIKDILLRIPGGITMERNIATKRLVELAYAIDNEHKKLLEINTLIDKDLKEDYSPDEKRALREIFARIEKRAQRSLEEFSDTVALTEKTWGRSKITRVK